MATLLIHVLLPFFLFTVYDSIRKEHSNTLLFYFLAAGFGLLPDVIGKMIFGMPFVVHFIVVWGVIVGIFCLFRRIQPSQWADFFLLAGLAYFIHPILDIHYPIPFFFPIISQSFVLKAEMTVQQIFPPIIREMTFFFGPSPTGAIEPYQLGTLINERDIQFGILLVLASMIAIYNSSTK